MYHSKTLTFSIICTLPFLLSMLLLILSEDTALCKKSKAEIQYELESEYINNRDDLDWGEKARARVEAYERIFEPEKRRKRLLKEAQEREEERREWLKKLRKEKILKKAEELTERPNEENSKRSTTEEGVPKTTRGRSTCLINASICGVIALFLIYSFYKLWIVHPRAKTLKTLKFFLLVFLIFLIFISVIQIFQDIEDYYREKEISDSYLSLPTTASRQGSL